MRIPWAELRERYPLMASRDDELKIDVATHGESRFQRVRLSVQPAPGFTVIRVFSTALDTEEALAAMRWLEVLQHNDQIRDVALHLTESHLNVCEDMVLFTEDVPIERLCLAIERVATFADRLERRVRGGDVF